MNSNDDVLPKKIPTDFENETGSSVIDSNFLSSPYFDTPNSENVTEEDCIALIVRSFVMQDLRNFCVEYPGDDLEIEYDFCNLRGSNLSTVDKISFITYAGGHLITVPVLLNALRKIRIPLFLSDNRGSWLAWDEQSQSLITNLEHQGGHLKRRFWPSGLNEDPRRISATPEKAYVFKLLRTSYLSSDYGKKPVLVHNSCLTEALEKRAISFDEPENISKTQINDYSLVYFTASGEVTSLPLSNAFDENVTISTRTGSYFHARHSGMLRPSLNNSVLWANSFRMSVENNPSRFLYYLRRNRGTVFQNVFEQIDMPSGIAFWYSSHEHIVDRAVKMAEWAAERNAKIYLTIDGHPLRSNDCESVTTPEHYACAVKKLHECDFSINNSSSGDGVALVWISANKLARFSEGPYTQSWKPVG